MCLASEDFLAAAHGLGEAPSQPQRRRWFR